MLPLQSSSGKSAWAFWEVLSQPLGLTVGVLTLIPLLLLPRAGVSFRFRRGRFPLLWLTGVVSAAAALAIFFAVRDEAGWIGPGCRLWPGISGVILALYLGLPVVHRLSGFRPATAQFLLRGWSPNRRGELLSALVEHMTSLDLEIRDARRWGCDLVAKGMIKGTVAPSKRIPYMIFVTLTDRASGLGVSVRADDMDIVIKDTGESRNCEVLLDAVVKRLEQPPFADDLEVDVNQTPER